MLGLYALRMTLNSLEADRAVDQKYIAISSLKSALRDRILELESNVLSVDQWLKPDSASPVAQGSRHQRFSQFDHSDYT